MSQLCWSAVLSTLGLASLTLTGHCHSPRARRAGWILGLADELAWTIYAVCTGQWPFIATATAYAAVYAHNLHRMRNDHATHR